MNHLEAALQWSTILFEVALCGFVFVRKLQRVLPLFSIYAYVLLADTTVLWLTYKYSGFSSFASYYVFYGTLILNAIARSLAILELCRYGLSAYRGIWALAWRILAVCSVFLLAHVVMDAWGQPNKVAIYGLTIDRDLALAAIVILGVLLLIRNYYGLGLNPLQRAVAAGICFICAIDLIGETVLRSVYTGYLFNWFLESQKAQWQALRPALMRANDLWSTVHLFCFMLAMGIWCFALRKPVPALSESPVLLPVEVYRELSPAINMRLATFNNRLVELLKP